MGVGDTGAEVLRNFCWRWDGSGGVAFVQIGDEHGLVQAGHAHAAVVVDLYEVARFVGEIL